MSYGPVAGAMAVMLTLHFANNGSENLTKSLNQTLPSAAFRVIKESLTLMCYAAKILSMMKIATLRGVGE